MNWDSAWAAIPGTLLGAAAVLRVLFGERGLKNSVKKINGGADKIDKIEPIEEVLRNEIAAMVLLMATREPDPEIRRRLYVTYDRLRYLHSRERPNDVPLEWQ